LVNDPETVGMAPLRSKIFFDSPARSEGQNETYQYLFKLALIGGIGEMESAGETPVPPENNLKLIGFLPAIHCQDWSAGVTMSFKPM
jgi:hypothetical protein